MMVVNPRRPLVLLWLVPITIPRNPGWLKPLQRVLSMVDTALLFPPLDRGGERELQRLQALLRDVIGELKRGTAPFPRSLQTGAGMLYAVPFRGTVGNTCCMGMDWLVQLRHGLALSCSPAQFLICSFWERVLEQHQTCCWTWSLP